MMHLLLAPFDDYLAALNASLRRRTASAVALIVVGVVVSWWIYVPIHELLHAWGCMAAGGSVTRLEIAPIYGAAWLQQFFPYISVGSEYAGQLTGFDTHGSDLIYLITDATPFVLTIFFGVPLLRWSGHSARRHVVRCLTFGVALPVAFAPFISLTGDYYEMGSIIVSRLAGAWQSHTSALRWRGDDLFKVIRSLRHVYTADDVLGVAASIWLGLFLASLTYGIGSFVGDAIARRSRYRPDTDAALTS